MCEDGRVEDARVEDALGQRRAVIATGHRASLPPPSLRNSLFLFLIFSKSKTLVNGLRSPVLAPSLNRWPHYAFTNLKKMIYTLNRCS
jgi:hypothetical protein